MCSKVGFGLGGCLGLGMEIRNGIKSKDVGS